MLFVVLSFFLYYVLLFHKLCNSFLNLTHRVLLLVKINFIGIITIVLQTLKHLQFLLKWRHCIILFYQIQLIILQIRKKSTELLLLRSLAKNAFIIYILHYNLLTKRYISNRIVLISLIIILFCQLIRNTLQNHLRVHITGTFHDFTHY